MSTRKVIIYKGKLYFSDVTVPTRVSQLANDAGYVTTDEKVKQTPTTSGGPYRILLSNDTDDTEHIDKVRKSSSLIYYPSGVMELTGTILGTETCKTTIQSYNIRINVTDDQNVSKYMDIWNDDISLSGNTWDGTNTSLKSALTYFNNLLQIKSLGFKDDLNLTATVSDKGTISLCTYTYQTSNTPQVNTAGFCFTFINSDSERYGAQFAISNGGVYWRPKISGSWSSWTTL